MCCWGRSTLPYSLTHSPQGLAILNLDSEAAADCEKNKHTLTAVRIDIKDFRFFCLTILFLEITPGQGGSPEVPNRNP